MDLPATQVFDENDLPTQKYSQLCQDDELKEVAVLIINSIPHAINKGINKIGRHPACNIVVDDQTVSKKHAEIEAGAKGKPSWICDLNSSNKTKLNTVPLRPNRNYELKHDSVIEFGKVRAVFKVCEDMDVDKDKSMIPATPRLTDRKPGSREIIPSTPDSSLNNSSALEEDLSSIPGTQADELGSVFRRPSLPRRRNSEEKSRTSLLQDSSLDNSADNSRVCTVVQESTGGDQSDDVNIHDMETQKPELSSSVDDIYDMETQRICTNIDSKNERKLILNPRQSKDIHDVETQDISNPIHEMETQKQVDVHNVETQNVSNYIYDAETQDAENDMHEAATQKLDVVRIRQQDTSHEANKSNNVLDATEISKEVENVTATGQSNDNKEYDNDFVKLTLTPNFEEDVNQLDVSSCQGSPNLIEGFFDAVGSPLNEEESHSKESSKESKSLEEENIFEAPTQQIKNSPSSKDNDIGKPNIPPNKDVLYILDSESETDDETIHIKETEATEKSAKPSKIQSQDSDGSETDEEGQFSEFARDRSDVNSSSLSRKINNEQNKSDPSTSVESDDIFEMPTQRTVTDEESDSKSEKVVPNRKIGRESSPQKITANQNDVVDSMAPTQLLSDTTDDSTSKIKNDKSNVVSDVNSEREKDTVDVDDMAPTQIINSNSPETKTFLENQLLIGKEEVSDPKGDAMKPDTVSTNDTTEQQSTFIEETSSESSFDERGRTPTLLGSIEDISYEMASTQEFDCKEDAPTKESLPQKSISKVTLRNNSKRGKPRTSLLDDTLERNLNNMFEGATRDSNRGRPSLMSSQCLQDVLQMSQDDRELLEIAVASGKIPAVKDAKVVLIRGLEPSGNSTPIPNRKTFASNSITENVLKNKSKRDSAVPKRASIPKVPSKTRDTRRQSRKVNLNDTIEKNLINMFDDVNEDIEEPPHISTQCLEDALQMSQVDTDPNNELSDNSSASAPQETKKAMGSKNARRTLLPSKSSTRATRSSLKDEIKFNENNVDSPSSETYFAKLTTRRKRNVLRDSQDSMDQSKLESNQLEKGTAKARASLAKANSAVLGKRGKQSWQTESTLKTQNDITTLQKANDSDDEYMASLPVAKIAGTVSNPVSPSTSSTYTVQNKRAKRKGKKGTEKKEMPSIKEYLSGNLNLGGSPKTKMDVGKIVDSKNDEEYKKLKIIADRLLSVKPKYIEKGSVFAMDDFDDVVDDSSNVEEKPIEAATTSRRKSTGNQSNSGKSSPILQSSKRARQSSKKDDEHSRVFQVENQKSAAKVAAESAGRKGKSKENTKENVVRGRKRSLSTAEKPKEDVTQKRLKLLGTKEEKATAEPARTRRSASKMDGKSESESILNFLSKNPPSRITRTRASTESAYIQQSSLTSQMPLAAKVRLESVNNTDKMRNEVNEPLVPLLNIKRIKLQNGETQFSSRNSVATLSQESIIPRTELEVKTTNVKGRKRKANPPNITVTSESGTESQEVEMIMKSFSSDVTSTSLESRKRPSTASVKSTGKNSKKRMNSKSNEEAVLAHSNSSDNHTFEAPTAKPKRGRVAKQKNQSNASISEEQPQRSARSLRSSQISIGNFSAGESTDGESHDSSKEKKSRPNRSRAAPKTKKTEQSDTDSSTRSRTDTEKSISSSVDSSIDATAMNSSPFRVRRSMSFMSTGSPSRTKHRVLFTGITDSEYGNILKKLGGVPVDEPTNCDVLVTDKVRRTVKFLCALAQSIPIVSVGWLTESKAAGRLLEWENFILKDPVAEAKFGFKLRRSLERAKQHKLLDGYTVLLTPKVAPPPIAEFKAMITCCGGKVIVRAPAKWQANTVIVSREEDSSNAKKFLSKAPSSVTVQSTEFILTGILRQELDFVKNKLL